MQLRQVVTMARQGLGVMRSARVALRVAAFFQMPRLDCSSSSRSTSAMRAFGIHAPLPAAGLVLVLMNVATIFPLWPGNVGLVQAAIALPLAQYGVPTRTGSPSASGCRRSRRRSASGSA